VWKRHEVQLRREYDAEGAFGSDHQAGKVERTAGRARVEVVAADTTQHLRKPAIDLVSMRRGQLDDRAITPGLERVADAFAGELGVRDRREGRLRAVREHDLLLNHVVDRFAVHHGTGATRVVRHHAADGGATGRGHVGRKAEPMRAEVGVELVEHHAGLDSHPSLLDVQLQDGVEVLRGVHDKASADGLAGLRGAPAAHRDRAVEPCTDLNDAAQLLTRPWKRHAKRRDLIHAGIG
jgi:hypothetical protein